MYGHDNLGAEFGNQAQTISNDADYINDGTNSTLIKSKLLMAKLRLKYPGLRIAIPKDHSKSASPILVTTQCNL